MWLSRLFKRRKTQAESQPEPQAQAGNKPEEKPESINQGIYYLYMIIGLQLLFVFGLLGVIMLIGKVISTPGWVFLLIFALFACSLVYIYRKAKKQFRKLRESFSQAGMSDKNYEISIMGGMLTMRIEQNPNAPKLLQAPASAPAEPIIDAETIEPSPEHKSAHLS